MVGDRIKKLREEKGYTINELAQRSHVSKSYISSIERGIQKNPSIKVLRKIAVTLNTSLETILMTDNQKIILDEDWLKPLEEAIFSGLTKEEFHEFLSFVHYKRRRRFEE
jgi:XRE family transcriptional regulator, master regulator for biofilm formation